MTRILILLIATISVSAWSQDIIKFKKGETLEVKVIEVNAEEITYEIPMKDREGPLYTVSLEKIEMIQYSNGLMDDFTKLKAEHADLDKAHLIDFNAYDLIFQRASFSYEYFPTAARDWSLIFPVSGSFNYSTGNHLFQYSPMFEIGAGANLYALRRNKHNFHVGLESNYNVSRASYYIYDPNDPYGSSFATQTRHFMGFYITSGYKLNFKPRIGLSMGFGLGWKYDLQSSYDAFQGKMNIGVFVRL